MTAKQPNDEASKISDKGAILAMKDGEQSPADALAAEDGKILYVGSANEAQQVTSPGAESAYLHQRCVLPGFIEPRLDLVMTALAGNLLLDLSPLKYPTPQSESPPGPCSHTVKAC